MTKNVIRVLVKSKLSSVFPFISSLTAGNYLLKLSLGDFWNSLAGTTIFQDMDETSFTVPSEVKL